MQGLYELKFGINSWQRLSRPYNPVALGGGGGLFMCCDGGRQLWIWGAAPHSTLLGVGLNTATRCSSSDPMLMPLSKVSNCLLFCYEILNVFPHSSAGRVDLLMFDSMI